LFFDFRFGVNAGCFASSISPTLSKRSASCAILVFGLYVGVDRDEQVPTAQLAGSNPRTEEFFS
jgi:hypothetical protein